MQRCGRSALKKKNPKKSLRKQNQPHLFVIRDMPAGTTSTCVDKSVFPSCQDLSLPHLSRCLPLSLPFDHFASTSEFPGSRAARYISDPLIVQGPRSPRASPISWNEGNRSTYRRNISRVPLGENSLVSNYFPGGRRKATYSRVLDRRGARECLFSS